MTTTEHTPAGGWDLVAAAQAGDAEAFGQLYRDYAPKISGFVRNRVQGDHQLVEDLTSETFLRAWRRIDTAHNDRGRDVGAWLATIARNLVTDHYKSARARYEHAVEELPEPRGTQAVGADPEQRVLDQYDREAAAATVRCAVEGLTPSQRRVVELYDLAPERQVSEVAEQLGRTEDAVKAMRHRAVRAMGRRLAGEGVTSSQQCLEAVSRARAAVDRVTQQRPQPVTERPAPAVGDRWADQSIASVVGLEVGA